MNLIEAKQGQRLLLKKAFADLLNLEDKSTFSRMEEQMNQNLREFLLAEQGIWGGYQSLANEVSIKKSMSESAHIQWAFPKVEKVDLTFYIPGNKGFEQGVWSQEPSSEGALKVEKLSGLIVPGLGFDLEGKRLGRGKGYYDRFLCQPGHRNVLKVGVTLEALMAEKLPAEEHDIGMDCIVTDKCVRRFTRRIG